MIKCRILGAYRIWNCRLGGIFPPGVNAASHSIYINRKKTRSVYSDALRSPQMVFMQIFIADETFAGATGGRCGIFIVSPFIKEIIRNAEMERKLLIS